MPIAGANISIRSIRNQATGAEINTTATNWTGASNFTASGGTGNISLTPSGSFVWPTGRLWVEYMTTYGNASTVGGREVIVAQKNFRIEGKRVYNASNASHTYVTESTTLELLRGNSTFAENFNISVSVNNPSSSSANADVSISLPIHTTNSSAIANNVTSLIYLNRSIAAGATQQFNWTFNVTRSGNWSGTITVTPKVSTMSVTSTSYSFESK